ncbi:MAG TPA: hypothetical protein VHV51_19065 [Polyangiaceae bacterium]|jgi:LmbE family N-acetylglucosaminyl deacetylase|nr:hypothetical protein [Polyangiaceae bacterium]
MVAHPDDETLWAGGTLLMQSTWAPFVTTLCRGSDVDRAPKFFDALAALSAHGLMADLDDGPEQTALADDEVERALLATLPARKFDRILTHSPLGEYTRHLRHEEVARAVLRLWIAGEISSSELWLFAYEDGAGKHLPKAIDTADIALELPREVWSEKYRILAEIYRFEAGSWEARVTPRREAFFRVTTRADASAWLTPKYCP